MSQIMWFRRDLRIADNPALLAAISQAKEDANSQVLPLYVLGPRTWAAMSAVQKHYLASSLASLNDSLGGALVFKFGDAREIIAALAIQIGAAKVHAAQLHTPNAIARDAEVEASLTKVGCELVFTGSAYAVAPGRVTKDDGTFYKVYTPFYKNWLKHGWRQPAGAPEISENWVTDIESDQIPELPELTGITLPAAGERAALARWEHFKVFGLADYADNRNRPDLDGTSMLSTALRFGEVHPRTLLADLDDSPGHEVFRKEIAWREFYADILFNRPDTTTGYYNATYQAMHYDNGDLAQQRFTAWANGTTGYTLVDAGMRQLRTTGWMHNRVRMVVASFLIKDLHLEWTLGAEHFAQWLTDFDVASNSHGWQWTAGCGTDASPYYRVFNPIGQAIKFDPTGDYVRKYVPELRHIEGAAVHEPWLTPDGLANGYPEPIVNHAAERLEALSRLEKLPKGKVQSAINPGANDQSKLIQSFE
jgi:deoxyribodipyrimidine photo-lyase